VWVVEKPDGLLITANRLSAAPLLTSFQRGAIDGYLRFKEHKQDLWVDRGLGITMIALRPRETVILASDFQKLVAWYRDILGFTVTKLFEDQYHYCNLETASGIKIGIASAAEMGVEPTDRSTNTLVLQCEVDDPREFFTHLEQAGGAITSGPSFDKNDEFWYGSFTDPEDNPVWVVDKNCP
jgi:predicted enzyme related to lactoylglutathione lyase